MNYSTNILKYILSPTTTTLARLCFMLFTCFYYSFITRSTWYFCCLSIRFTIYSNWFTMSPCSSFPFYYNFITRSTSFYLLCRNKDVSLHTIYANCLLCRCCACTRFSARYVGISCNFRKTKDFQTFLLGLTNLLEVFF